MTNTTETARRADVYLFTAGRWVPERQDCPTRTAYQIREQLITEDGRNPGDIRIVTTGTRSGW